MSNTAQRVALVTGGASGMGASTCRRFARDGMAVGVLDINLEGARAVAGEINASGGKAMAVEANIADKAQVEIAVNALRNAFGPIQVLVNNAALEGFSLFAELTEEQLDRMFAVNLKGIFFMTQAVLPDMDAAGWGRIINIAAYGAQLVEGYMSHYYASKGGVIALTRAMAAEFGPKGITVNSVSPGFIDTPMARRAIESGDLADPSLIYNAYPIQRLGKPEEIAAACAYFASEDAAYVTAQLLGVNGGAVG
ncbi:SDR family NAD(P)-dependent oxidoreductase [Haliea sp. E17]|uniref:SDR family NAD(P)-dependent oxidoreductase n=1 Tax=Haliea sp. E17 TaxID=3401576 RepID=UPI003AAAB463